MRGEKSLHPSIRVFAPLRDWLRRSIVPTQHSMRRHIRNAVTGEYLKPGGWTKNTFEATNFESIPEAIRNGLEQSFDTELVVRVNASMPEITVPIRRDSK